MNIGDKFIWKPYNHAKKRYDAEHIWYGHIVTVIGFGTVDRVKISVDDFPDCNHRELKNRFCADVSDLFEIK